MNKKLNFSLVCLECGKTYIKSIKYSIKRYGSFKFCCRDCYIKHGDKTQFKKGHKGMIGENNPAWTGDNCSYMAVHVWVHRWLQRSKKCELCSTPDGKHQSGRPVLQAANKSGEYRRDLNDWIWLCSKCHSKYDKNRNSIKNFILSNRYFNK